MHSILEDQSFRELITVAINIIMINNKYSGNSMNTVFFRRFSSLIRH